MDAKWERDAATTLRRISAWWHADAPGRTLGGEEAHLLANLILQAECLADLYDEERSSGTQGTGGPPGTRSDA